jgi:hypothetical protein
MSDGQGGYLPPLTSLVAAYAGALDDVWELPLQLWRTVVEAAYPENLNLTRMTTTVFIPRDKQKRHLDVKAKRLALNGGPPTRVDVTIDPESVDPIGKAGGAVAEISVVLHCPAPRGAYRLEFRAKGWAAPLTRTVNFGI